MENFFIIDGNSLINRAFYALPLLSNDNGEYSNAVYGFCNILTKLITENKVDKVLVAFDVKAKTFRHEIFEDYKAGRKGMPDELYAQMPILKEMLRLMEIPILEKEGFEADDIIGTLSTNLSTKNFIITGDKDSLQLISDNTEVWLTKKGISEIEKFDKTHLKEVYGLEPYQIVDLKALMGDSSDNIPGVKGIGEKTALSLLETYKTVENLYAHIDEIKGKMQEKLIAEKDMCFMSKTLAQINKNVNLNIDLNSFKLKFPFNNKVAEFFKKYQFKTLLNKRNLFCEDVLIEEQKIISSNLIKTQTELDNLIEDLKRNNLFSIVCGEDVHISNSRFQENIICIKKDLLSDGLDYDFVLNKLKPILEDENIKKILFDVKNSKYFFAQYSISIKGEIFDVKLADYLTKCGRRHVKSLEELCEQENYKINSVSGMLFNCFNLYTKKLNDFDMQFLYNSIEFPLINVLYGMEVDGFKLDFNILKKMNEDYNKELKQLNDEIIMLAGEKFNLNSPKQLGNILFEKLGLPNLQKGSTNIEVLENLQNVHPIIDLIIRYRKIYKLNSTYVDAYLEKMDKSNHIVHTYFNQMLTQTGRLSSTEPNLQNIPIREDEGRNLRKIFISRFDNGQIISADYSQIELRLLAHFSCDEKLVDAFNKNLDIHASTASEIFNVPLNLVTSEMRRKAKAVNFGIVYGISDYGLSQSLHCSRKEAKEFIDKYFETYPNVKKYLESSIVFAKENGFVKTMFNRRRFIDELNSNNYNLKQFGERVALNMPLQGTASDIIKLAMIEVEKEFENKNLKSKLILQIHDELICDTYPGEEDKVSNILLEKMQNVVKLNIPLVVNLSIGKSLYEAKD